MSLLSQTDPKRINCPVQFPKTLQAFLCPPCFSTCLSRIMAILGNYVVVDPGWPILLKFNLFCKKMTAKFQISAGLGAPRKNIRKSIWQFLSDTKPKAERRWEIIIALSKSLHILSYPKVLTSIMSENKHCFLCVKM